MNALKFPKKWMSFGASILERALFTSASLSFLHALKSKLIGSSLGTILPTPFSRLKERSFVLKLTEEGYLRLLQKDEDLKTVYLGRDGV